MIAKMDMKWRWWDREPKNLKILAAFIIYLYDPYYVRVEESEGEGTLCQHIYVQVI